MREPSKKVTASRMQNMVEIHKKNRYFVTILLFRFLNFWKILICLMYFGVAGVLFTTNCYFEYRIRILCLLLYMGTYLKDIFRHCSTFWDFRSQKC